MAGETRVDVFGGKYTVILGDDGSSRALRYGEFWPGSPGALNNLERALAVDLDEARGDLAKARDASRALYMAGRWSCAELPAAEQARLWEELRDALGLTPGTATEAGVAAATNLCPYCAEKPDCDCEPPLPFDRPGAEL